MKNQTLTLPVLAIVIPCFNESQVIEKTATYLQTVLMDLVKKAKIAPASFIYFVEDGSSDNSWDLIQKLHRVNETIKGLKLSRNFGHQNALLGGIMQIKDKADCILTMDADLQDDADIIEQFIDQFHNGFEIVYGVRKKRESDSFFKKYSAILFYKFISFMGVTIIPNHADYRLISKRIANNLAQFKETNLFLRGLMPLIGFKSTEIYYNRKKRASGKSKYTLLKMLGFAVDGITSFSIAPLRFIAALGILFFTSSLFMIMYIIFAVLCKGKIVPGWASTVLPIYFIGGVQLLSISIIGEYVGKIYQEIKARPRFIIDSEIP